MRMITTATLLGVAAALAFVSTPAIASYYAPEAIESAEFIYGGESHFFEVYADRGETMFVELYGYDDWADLDVIVTDERGRVVADGTSMSAWEEFDFVARREGVYTIEVVNLEVDGCVEYDLTVY